MSLKASSNGKEQRMYKIGQLLYFISSAEKTIETAYVLEKRTTELRDGITVSHICVNTNGFYFSAETELNRVKYIGPYSSVEEAEQQLLQNAKDFISVIADRAKEQAATLLKRMNAENKQQENVTEATRPSVPAQNIIADAGDIPDTITLPDGRIAKVRLPPVPQ
jgi:hypothetical protein